MRCRVDFYGHNGDRELQFGSIGLSNGRLSLLRGPDGSDRLLEGVLSEPIVTSDGEEVHAGDDPKAFLNGLSRHYKSYALRATEPIDVVPEPPEVTATEEQEDPPANPVVEAGDIDPPLKLKPSVKRAQAKAARSSKRSK